MKYEILEGKDLEELKKTALENFKCEEKDLIFVIDNLKKNIFKSGTYQLKVCKIVDIANYIKEFLVELLKNMDINIIDCEINIRDNQINLTMHSDKDNILIGREGKTLRALENIVKQHVYNKINIYPYLILNASNYKERHEQQLVRLAKKVAREVVMTNREIIMDNMNSYERRIIHNTLTNFKGISTISEGTEPNRHIVVKPNDEK